MKYNNLLDAIGNTPLVQINFTNDTNQAKIFAKLEYLNPGGSMKDRSALYMIEEAERLGILKPGGTLIDASSGNHGVAVAMIGKIKGYKVVICVFEKCSQEKLQTIKSYGAQVIVCPNTTYINDPKGYHSVALELHRNTPNSFMPNQYFNISNAMGHELSMGPEIWKQTEGKITHFFAAAGTGGTITGVGRYLKKQNPDIKIIAIDSNNSFRATNGNPKPYKIEGIGMDFDTPVTDRSIMDDIVEVSDENGLGMLKTLSTEHGFLVGPSSGAVAWAAQSYLPKLKPTDVAVIMFGDSGRAYLSKGFYDYDDVSKASADTNEVKTEPTVKKPETQINL